MHGITCDVYGILSAYFYIGIAVYEHYADRHYFIGFGLYIIVHHLELAIPPIVSPYGSALWEYEGHIMDQWSDEILGRGIFGELLDFVSRFALCAQL